MGAAVSGTENCESSAAGNEADADGCEWPAISPSCMGVPARRPSHTVSPGLQVQVSDFGLHEVPLDDRIHWSGCPAWMRRQGPRPLLGLRRPALGDGGSCGAGWRVMACGAGPVHDHGEGGGGQRSRGCDEGDLPAGHPADRGRVHGGEVLRPDWAGRPSCRAGGPVRRTRARYLVAGRWRRGRRGRRQDGGCGS